jgi:hypothetical protein
MNAELSIDLRDWDVTYTDLVKWVTENNVDLWGVNAMGGNGAKIYVFSKPEDLTAFKLRFAKETS